ncbi:sugar phosphate isomerase/epimerase family protein [Brevibacillus marinus]|uniref:sugar phosphate isomerase/epimerase family protein n=1 Tax=Brevibacillus marinus TaxID=2496837 RepID=UPI000F842C70|nr:sugar phosphate isomerase/epimerase family protein [Brevibacillus marinus]
MKFAYAYGTQETKAPVLGLKGPEHEVFPRLKAMGYSAVELLVRDPKRLDPAALVAALRTYGLQVAAVGTGPVVSDDGLTLTAANPEVREAALQRLKDIVEFASLFGCPVLLGKARGDLDLQAPALSRQWMKEGLEQLTRHAEHCGVSISLEPQNRKVINNVNTTREAVTFIESLRLANLCLMLDLYHMHVEGESFAHSFALASDKLNHLHVADSNRGTPGSGTLDFAKIMQLLKEIGYKGYISFELSQGTDGYRTAQTAIEHMLQLPYRQ